eukprot:CAMPEP_0181040904 /NCGR_PEP_ID=MMETSP1070-20121207/11309_1 /TAXON_ID=265543 /ORGANISM="Minutocellus polymorphus, Strain NH13" /LENGTH=461 /DNA_ID=CAMNT_0023118969 /DNA_START=71 /DNA_END=1456 /DNA_ORIENTATION=-
MIVTTLALLSRMVGVSAFQPSPLMPSRPKSPTSSSKPSHPSSSALNMFTGIVEEMGTVVSLEQRDDMTLWDGTTGSGTELVVKGDVAMDGAYLGCSIAVNGVCLTATALDSDASTFAVGLAPETLRRTYFADGPDTFGPGTAVNLERASEIGGRNSGHFVQGHVDGVGTVIDRWIDEDSLWYKVQVSPEILRYIVPKGFIAIDGTSLTVCEVDTKDNWFTFMLIEYTQKHIVVPNKLIGDKLNIETDCLGKYSESAMATLVPRIETLEGTVESLQREIADMKKVGADLVAKIGSMSGGNGGSSPRAGTRGSTQSLGAAKPTYGGTITNWKLLPNNIITGSALDNPEIDDGSDITSSVIVNPEIAQEGATVQTRSGILYKLGQQREAVSVEAVVNGASVDSGDLDWKPKSEGGTTIDIYKREHEGQDDIYGRDSGENEEKGDGNDDNGDADRPKLRVVGVDW